MGLLIAWLLIQDRPPTPPRVDVTLEGDAPIENATLERIADGHVEFSGRRESVDRVRLIRRRIPAEAPAAPDTLCVETIGPLACTILDLNATRVRVKTPFAGEIDVPLTRVNDLVYGGPHFGALHGATYVAVTKAGVRIEAAAAEFTKTGLRIGDADVARADLKSLAFPSRPVPKDAPGEGWYAWVECAGGAWICGVVREMDASTLRLFSAALGPLSIDARLVNSIRFDDHPAAGWTLLLISEDDCMRVYNPAGTVVWEWVAGNPCDAVVLPDGNLMYRHHEGKEILTATFARKEISKLETDAVIEDFTRLSDGRVAACTQNGLVLFEPNGTRADPVDAKSPVCVAEAPGGTLTISDENGISRGDHRWTNAGLAKCYDFVVLPNGHLLAAIGASIQELDDAGEIVWSSGDLQQPSDALRLRNGNTLIIEDATHRLIEMTPDHKTVWEKTWPKRIVDIFVIE